ncbi:MAG: Na+/H+ antiporter NhaA, partial [Sciscionella sp.]
MATVLLKAVRSERVAAGLLLGAAILALILANTPPAGALLQVQATQVGIPAIGLDLSIGHWISDGLLAIFFFLIAIELKHELM